MSNSTSTDQTDSQRQILELGEKILSGSNEGGPGLFNKDWWYGRIMDWSMQNESFKTQMFRFVDVLPYLESGSEVARHLKEYFAEGDGKLPSIFNFGLGLGSLAPGLMASTIKKNVTQMAKMFITGANPSEAIPVLRKSRKAGLTYTIDLLGEATLSEKEASDYQQRYTEVINTMVKECASWKEDDAIDLDDQGKAIPKVNVSVKVTSLYSQVDEKAWRHSIDTLKERLKPLFDLAMENNVFINIDMEQYAHKDLTLQLFEELSTTAPYDQYPHWGIVIQCYLKDSKADIERLIAIAKKRATPFTVRLVKGAYWDFETIHAEQMGWPIPVYTVKSHTDANYEECTRLMIDNHPHIRLALGSHNVRSLANAMVYAKNKGLNEKAIEVQMLYGMAEPIKRSINKMGYRVREYATVGDLIPGMAYLVRRLLENTSNESFLRSKYSEDTSIDVLMAKPADEITTPEPTTESTEQFINEAPIDFVLPELRKNCEEALASFKPELAIPIIINGKAVKTGNTLKSVNPSHPSEVVGEFQLAGVTEAENAIQACEMALPTWAATPMDQRADYLDKLADCIFKYRFDLIALEVKEVGKTISEADGDITEAIDFCRYYAREARQLGKPVRIGNIPGEVSLLSYESRGIALAIAPWNFPLAILAGLVVAPMVCGNTVIIKPAEQSSVTAYWLFKMLDEIGLPKGVVQFLPGLGETVGAHLVKHAKVSIINFTGSKEVGLQILKESSILAEGQTHIKKCVIEMGGKNALIIDNDADLDEAVAGVVYSAFGFQGQKCSACSRVFVVQPLYERFKERLIEATKSIEVGFCEDPKTFLGPVIDGLSQKRLLSTIEAAKSNHKLIYQSDTPDEGYFVPATIFEVDDVKSDFMTNEHFGPLLGIIPVKNLDTALQWLNDSEFALTGGIYSRSPDNIAKAKAEIGTGNVYINRGITGAMVNRHPFGGRKLSGVGSKTGGPDYLKQFTDPKIITENTVRRGFAPE